jgi:hypothetical protein
MLNTQQHTSGESLHDLRQRVLQGFPCRAEVLVNMIDALSVGPRPATPSELVLSPLWGYASSTLYSGLRASPEPATVTALREARLQWWETWGETLRETPPELGRWRVKVLDATRLCPIIPVNGGCGRERQVG